MYNLKKMKREGLDFLAKIGLCDSVIIAYFL